MQVWLRPTPRALLLVNEQASSKRGAREQLQLQPQSQLVLVVSTAGSRDDQGPLPAHGQAQAIVEMLSVHDIDWDSCIPLAGHQSRGQRAVTGCLGLMNVGNDLFMCVVTQAAEVGAVRPGEMVMAISSVAFYCVNRSTWDGLDAPDQSQQQQHQQQQHQQSQQQYHPGMGVSQSSSSLDPYDAILPQSSSAGSANQAAAGEHPCASLKRLLGMGSFYFAADGAFDLSTRLSRRVGEHARQHDLSQYDGRFVWNTFMISPLMDFRSRLETPERDRLDREGFFLLAVQGYVAVFDMTRPTMMYSSESDSVQKNQTTSLALVSRLSWKRAGTRFNTRGVDDDGNVANFVETETIFNHEGVSTSYVQLRGSVPLFWEQQGLQAFSPRIQITRSRQASQPAFDRHFADLISQYSRVHALNLLGTRDAETVLANAYAEHVRASSALEQAVPPEDEDLKEEEDLADDERLDITNFDFHTVSRNTGGLDGVRAELKMLGPVRLKRESFSCTIVDSAGTVRRRQNGAFRTNCLDCLDRTNVVQAFLSEMHLEDFFERAGRHRDSFQAFAGGAHPVWSHHRTLWAENGDALSRIYAGTGAINTTYTRTGNAKRTIGSMLSDAAKSAGRMYINNFQDRSKQNVIDALLGNMANQRTVEVYDPINDSATAELNSRLDEYSTRRDIDVFAGTWNLNARSPAESLLPWLSPPDCQREPDVYALGFQEIVQLTPQQILLTDPAKLRVWENMILDTLERRPNKKSHYIIMRSEQLVGTALIVLVKADLIPHVRSVEATSRKTGLKGMSGNKGGVAIRLSFYDTTFCFTTAHLAAGHANFEERNQDYWTISRGLTFQRGRTMVGHDHVIWLGDFNYRIDMSNERARALARQGDFATLYDHDQLNRCRHLVFSGFDEGPLTFAPTYKYDVNSDAYDSSEKQRIPAWTDRIFYSRSEEQSGHQLSLLSYSRAELKTSDHRPVYALFQAEVRIFDKDKRNSMRREILLRAKAGQGRSVAGLTVGANGTAEATSRAVVDGDDEEEDDDLPEPSDVNGDQRGQSWFDVDRDEDAASSQSEASGDASDEDSAGSLDANPFLQGSKKRVRAAAAAVAAAAAPETGDVAPVNGDDHSSSAQRRAPPPAPPRPAKPTSLSASSATSNELAAAATSKGPPPPRPPPAGSEKRRQVSSGASSDSFFAGAAQAEDEHGADEDKKPSVPPRRPPFGQRSTSHGSEVTSRMASAQLE
ncbi:unnamed protein product [Jaminaea pallidilutea]